VDSEAEERSDASWRSALARNDAMTQEESLVLSFLQTRPESTFSRGEIARRAAKRKVFEADPHWVDVPLTSLVAKKYVAVDANGDYQFSKTDLD